MSCCKELCGGCFGGVVVHHYLEADAEVAAAMAEVA